MLSHFELITRIAVGAALGGIIGYERDRHNHNAGLRTHLIVSMASATFMVISAHFAYWQGYGADSPHIEIDASRIAAAVVTGVGFLAGGSILKNGSSVRGLTTAAGLWLVSAIGLGAGAGMYAESFAVTIMGVLALTVLRMFEDKNDNVVQRYVSLTLADSPNIVRDIMALLTDNHIKVSDFDYDKRIEEKQIGITFAVKIPQDVGVAKVIEILENHSETRQLRLRRTREEL